MTRPSQDRAPSQDRIERDLQFAQVLDYPSLDVQVDRKKAGLSGVTPTDVGKALQAPTSSTRFLFPNAREQQAPRDLMHRLERDSGPAVAVRRIHRRWE